MKPWFTPEPSSLKHSALQNVLRTNFHQATRTKLIALLVTIAAAAWTSDVFSQTITETYSTAGSYTFTVPQGVTTLTVECWGGGGAGGGNNNNTNGGGGGGGGGYSRSTLTVIPGASYSLYVGAGGTGGTTNDGGDGEASWFENTSTVMARGGLGGKAATTRTGGTGAALGVGSIRFMGGNGGDGRNNTTGTGGGGGSSAGTAAHGNPGTGGGTSGGAGGTQTGAGAGGNGGSANAHGSAGSAPGGGGGGSGDEATTQNRTGGAGGVGRVSIAFALPDPAIFYSRQSGTWNNNSTWSVFGHSGSSAGMTPRANDIVLIGDGHTVTIPSNYTTSVGSLTVHDSGSSGTLIIGETSNTASSFTITGNLTINSSGTFRTGGDGGGTRTVNIEGDIVNDGVLNLNYTNDTGVASFNGSATRTLSGSGSYVFQNFTINAGGNNLNINSNIRIDGTLTFSANGLLIVDANSNITLGSVASVNGANSSRYIQLDGSSSENSNLVRITSASTTPWDFIYHVGTSIGGYTPVDLPTIGTTPDANATLAIKPIITGNMSGRLKRTFRFIVTGNSKSTTFTNGSFKYIDPIDFSSGDSDANYTTVWRFSSGTWTVAGTSVDVTNKTFSASGSLGNGTYYYTIGSSLSAQRTWYSYQTGNFNSGSTWTLDPSGTSHDNGFNLYPGLGDEIHILNGLTVNVNVSGLSLTATTIHGGGTLNLGTTIGHNIGIITGTGLLRIKGTELPSGIYTDFVGTNGGTIEYYDVAGSLSTTQTTYNHLKMTNSTGAITYALVGTLNVNGTFDIGSSGSGTVTWQINDGSNTQRTITLNGNLNIGTNGRITAGTGNPTNAHNLTIYGNFTNNGIVQFFSPTSAPFSGNTNTSTAVTQAALTGRAVNVTFGGTSNQTLTLNNQTDFYRFIVNKGTSQQPILTVNSSNTAYFRLFGPSNIATTESGNSWEYISRNALSIINGTLELTGSINIPYLCIGSTSASDYFPIPRNGALWLNGSNVSVQISDNTTAGYNSAKDGRIMISGLLRITAGTLNDGFSKGLGSWDGGSYLQEGGTVNCWQFRPKADGTGVFSFKQTGGTLNVGYGYALSGGKIDQYEEDYCRFDLRSPNCSFQMSGNAVLNVAKPTYTDAGPGGLFRISSKPGNYNVTGGTVNLYAGYKTATNAYPGYINTTAPIYNLNIYEESATTQTVQLINNPLIVLNNLTIHSGNDPSFETNNLDLTIGGNFTISANTTFNPGTSTITFNGTGTHKWTNNGTITNLTNVIVEKTGTLTLDGTTSFPDITGTTTGLMLKSGTLNDGGKTITVTGALSNSATHTGSGVLVYNRPGSSTIEGSNGTFGNLTIQTSNTVSTAGAQTITGNLRLTGTNTKLNIGSNALSILGNIYSNASTGIAFSADKLIITSGMHNAGGLTRNGAARDGNNDLIFPLGTGTLYTPNTIRVTVGAAGTHGTITVRPVASQHPNVTAPDRSLKYYWRVTSTGYTNITAVEHRSYTFNSTSLLAGTTTAPDFQQQNYRPARFDRTALKWSYRNLIYDARNSTVIQNFETESNWYDTPGRQLDGEYTAGYAGAFDVVKVYYSKNAGSGPWNWNSLNSWTHNPDHINDGTVVVSATPCATCPVIIGDGGSINHTITVNGNNITCGTLEINSGSTLDCGIYTGLNFGVNTTGRGILRIASPNFPAGDFLDFLGTNGGTVEWYAVAGSPNSTNPNGELTGALTLIAQSFTSVVGPFPRTITNVTASSTTGSGSGAVFTVIFSNASTISSVTVTTPGSGYAVDDEIRFNENKFSGSSTTRNGRFRVTASNIASLNGYIIPSTGASPQSLTLDTYYNLMVNPIAGKTIMLPANNLTVHKNWVQQGAGTVTNYGTRSLSIKGDMTISSGTFELSSGNTDITVAGNVSNSGIFTTTSSTHKLALTGNLTNNGTVNFNNTGTVALKFEGSTNVTFGGSGTGGTTLYTVEVNKGSSTLPTVTFNTGGTVTTTAATNGWLTLTNGTFDFANATSYTTSLSTNAYTIPSTAKLKVSGANVVVNTTSGDNDNYDLFLNGALEVAGGTVNVGNTTVNSNNVDIEYVAAGTPSITVSSGLLWVKSSVRRSTATVTGALVYTQSGGTVTVGGIDSDNTRGVFEIDYNTGSSFSLMGTATLNVQRQNNATNCVTTYADVLINPATTSNVSATSTITVGLTGTPQTNFRVDIVPAIGNFSIQNGSAATNQRVWLYSNLTLKGALNIPVYAVLNASCPTPDANVTLAGNFVCAGTYTGGTNTTVFNGTGAQSATLSTSTQFYNVTVSKSAGSTLTLEGSAPTPPALNNLNVLTGILNVSDGIGLTVNHDITINSSQVGTGSIVVYSTAGTSNTINSNGGSFTNLTLGGTATSQAINVSGNLAINGALTFGANRYLNIASYQLSLGSAASVSGAGSSAFIRTNGVASDKGVVKTWATGTSSFTYPVGTSTNYTPTAVTLNVTTGGNLSVIPVNGAHLTYNTGSPELILNYYWTVKRSSALVASVTSHTYSFPSSLLTGVGGALLAGFLDLNSANLGWVTDGHGGSINTGVLPYRMEYTSGYANFPAHDPLKETSFDYSVGTSETLPNPIKPLYSRLGTASVRAENGGGIWNLNENWTTEADGDPDNSEPTFGGSALYQGPRGVPVVILPGAQINMTTSGIRAYRTTIDGVLYLGYENGSVTSSHNIGKIDGTGVFRTPTNTFPAGDYSDFISSNGGTIEYEVTSDNSPLSMNSVNLTTAPNTVTYNNLAIAPGSSGVLTMTDDKTIINGNLAIPSGITISNAHNRDIAIAGNWSNDGTFSPGTGAVIFDGSADKSVSGSTGFYSLTVSKTDANLNLTGSGTTTINGTLTMTDGHLIPDANHTLILSSTGTTSGGSEDSYISGKVQKVLNSGSITLPIGKISPGHYRPVSISNPSAADTWCAEYIGHNPGDDGYDPSIINSTSEIKSVSIFEYWNICRGSSASANLTLSYSTGSYTGSDIGDVTELRVARWHSDPDPAQRKWDTPPGVTGFSHSGDNVTGTITAINVTDFSPFTIASINASSNTPVTWLAFSGRWVSDDVELVWSVSNEIDNDRFEVERSLNGVEFSTIGVVAGAGTYKGVSQYTFVDTEASSWKKYYYRIRQVDFDGKEDVTKTIVLMPEGTNSVRWLAYPNPSKQLDNVVIEDTQPEQNADIAITLMGADGRVILRVNGSLEYVNSRLSRAIVEATSGIYLLRVQQQGYTENIKLIHQ